MTKKPTLDADERALISTLKKAKTQLDQYLDYRSCQFQSLEEFVCWDLLLNSKAFERDERMDELSKLIPVLIEVIRDKADYPPHPLTRAP